MVPKFQVKSLKQAAGCRRHLLFNLTKFSDHHRDETHPTDIFFISSESSSRILKGGALHAECAPQHSLEKQIRELMLAVVTLRPIRLVMVCSHPHPHTLSLSHTHKTHTHTHTHTHTPHTQREWESEKDSASEYVPQWKRIGMRVCVTASEVLVLERVELWERSECVSREHKRKLRSRLVFPS